MKNKKGLGILYRINMVYLKEKSFQEGRLVFLINNEICGVGAGISQCVRVVSALLTEDIGLFFF